MRILHTSQHGESKTNVVAMGIYVWAKLGELPLGLHCNERKNFATVVNTFAIFSTTDAGPWNTQLHMV